MVSGCFNLHFSVASVDRLRFFFTWFLAICISPFVTGPFMFFALLSWGFNNFLLTFTNSLYVKENGPWFCTLKILALSLSFAFSPCHFFVQTVEIFKMFMWKIPVAGEDAHGV